MQEPTGLFIDGTWVESSESADVLDKFTREPIRRVSVSSEEHVAAAVAGAQSAARHPLSPASRSDILLRAADLLDDRADEIERDYVAETGFTIADARVERERAAQVFRLSAGEAIRYGGTRVRRRHWISVRLSRSAESRRIRDHGGVDGIRDGR